MTRSDEAALPSVSRRAVAMAVSGRHPFVVGMVAVAVLAAVVSVRGHAARHAAAVRAPIHRSAPVASETMVDPIVNSMASDLVAVHRYGRLGYPLYCAGGARRLVALTFDDGPGPQTAAIVRQLRAARAPATFFEIGRNVVQRPELAREEAAIGVVGDHTWSHLPLTKLPAGAIRRQLVDARVAIVRATGFPVVLFRPPYGVDGERVNRIARRAGLLPVLWSVDSRDWEDIRLAEIKRNLTGGLRPGAIILFHEQGQRTLPALRWLLAQLRKRGLQPVTVPELLALDGPGRAQLQLDQRARACATP